KTHHIPDEVLHEILHALAFNTLLSSQETDAYSAFISYFYTFTRFASCQILEFDVSQIPSSKKPSKTYRAIMGVSNQRSFPVALRVPETESQGACALGPVRLARRPDRSRGENKD
ncbi:hypothetical protein, partial [Nonomuraea endophytica]|uniref:hypothetical protein n=1 Tax=Nonomuraea endophytica TaxID=714136 RepID=UPI0037CA217C